MAQHNITQAYITKFDDSVKQSYQEVGGKLRGAVHNRTGVVGTKHTFNIYGLGVAKERGAAGSEIETMGSQVVKAECDLVDKQASEYSDIFENDKINFDDEQELVKVIAAALGRAEDQLVIDAFKAAGSVTSPSNINDIPTAHKIAKDFESSGTNTGLTVEKIEEAVVLLDDAGVPAEGRIFIAPAKAKRALLASAKATSGDFVGEVRPLVNGQIDEFLGFKFIWIADTKIGTNADADASWLGLPGAKTSATERLCYAFHRDSVALAVGNLDKQTRIDYVPQVMSYLVASPLRAGAVVREGRGVVQVEIKK